MVDRIRLTFTTEEVGNGSAYDANALPGQDGGLAVRSQAQDEDRNPFGPIVRSSDEGTTFGPIVGVRYDVHDLVFGVQYGDQFTHAILGTQGDDIISSNPIDANGPIYINLGQGNDTAVGTSTDDVLIGGAGNDRLYAAAGNDSLIGGNGDDVVDGGPGFDTTIFGTTFADMRLVQGGSTTIFDGPEGIDTLTDIDRLEFADIAIGFRPDVFSALQTGPDSPGVRVAALYDGIFGREVDASGLAFFSGLLDAGVTPDQVANALLNSVEYTSRFGLPDRGSNDSFVANLYQVALGRAPDRAGLNAHVSALDNGTSRAEIAANIALSDENFAGLTVDETGILVPDANAAAVARLYFGLLDRAPDVGGLENFVGALETGATLEEVAHAIFQSEEGQAQLVGETDVGFSIGVYENVFSREIGPRAFAELLTALRYGATPADIATGYVQSAEALSHFAPVIEQGWVLV